jgi:hypothetical protein
VPRTSFVMVDEITMYTYTNKREQRDRLKLYMSVCFYLFGSGDRYCRFFSFH